MPESVKDDLSDLVLDDDINVRLRSEERLKLDRAAVLVSRQRRGIVKPSTLARELINVGVDRILEQSS